MWLRGAVVLLALGYVAYRVALAVHIARARRAGDEARVVDLRTNGFRLYRWGLAAVALFVALLTLLVLVNNR
jgi:hypothetical protein